MFLEKRAYDHVMKLMDGTIAPPPILVDFQAWFQEKYSTKLYDYLCDTTYDGAPRLQVILWDTEDTKFMCQSRFVPYRKVQEEIRDEFARLSLHYQCNAAYQNPKRVFVSEETIADEIRTHLFAQTSSQITAIRGTDVWKIIVALNTVHLFYLTEENRKRHQGDAQENRIIQQVYDIVLPLDKHGAFSRGICFAFSSKEILDTQYQGSTYYYLL